MAKGSNNLSGRRSSSRNAKPYDANNSFVKKVATKVTDLIPQRSWISKWFNSSQNEGELDDTENPEDVESEEDTQKPPPLKRPCIRMDVTHPPGTFSIQPRVTTSFNKGSRKQQYSVHNETTEDFSEPVMAGPSGMSRLISSTPGTQTDIRNIVPRRSELNSLVAATNNGTTNGADDNSESSESTSGCSSLIPQTNRQEAPSNASYNSPFSQRKRYHDDKLTFTNHAQSPRSLFLDNSTRDSLSSHRPSFNASVMINTPDRASLLSSPFYSGNITFGGANAAGLYKRGRDSLNNPNEVQLKVPRRTSVEVKPSNTTGVDSSGMSQTAKKILEALEHFSSPVTDAKKIPLKMMNNTSISKKRSREETTTPTKVGLRHLTRELTVPTVPDILKLRRRQRLQDTTLAARKIVSERSKQPPSQEYHLRTQSDEDSKHHGKLKVKPTNRTVVSSQTVEPVNLPSIPLPISSLPSFNFMPPTNSKTVDTNSTGKEETFTFASPIKVTSNTKTLKSINNFTFSSPINADKQSIDISNNSSLSLKGSADKSNSPPCSCVSTVTQNFIFAGSSTAPRPKDKTKNRGKPAALSCCELRFGSVMDVLSSKPNKTEHEQLSETRTHLDSNNDSAKNKASAVTSSESQDDTDAANSKPDNSQQDASTMWECAECLIKNSNSETKCFACKTAKPSPKNNNTCELSSTSSNTSESKDTVNDHFGSQFKLSSNQWECVSCYVRNKQTDAKCVACSAPKPDSKHEAKSNVTKPTNSDLNNLMKGSWECSKCSFNNSASSTTCISCNTSKPNLIKSSPKEDTNIGDVNTVVNQKTSISTNTTVDNSNSTKSEIMDKFKPSKDTWECPCCMVRNAASVDSCPCCNTAKPNATIATKNVPPPLANGFGDKFKKPEGAWNCDTCMLQNEAKTTICVACGGLKPGSKKSENLTANTNLKEQFNFGIPANGTGFKFGIDKADQQEVVNATPTNGFKFGSSKPSSQIGQFTFGIQKEEKKTSNETMKSESSAPSTSGSGFGFQINKNNSEKTDVKQDSKQVEKKSTSSFSFNVPKSEDVKVGSDTKSVNVTSSTTLPSTFTFSMPKFEMKQPNVEKEKQGTMIGNAITEVSKQNTETTKSLSVTSANTLISLAPSSSQEPKPTTIFSFGVPSSTVVVSSSTATNVVTSLPSSIPSTFSFPETKSTTQAAPVPTFGQTPTSTPASTLSNTFTFGKTQMTEDTTLPKTFGTLPSGSSGSSIFSNISSAPPLFSTTDAKTTSAFGTKDSKPPAFGASENKPSAFAMPENKVPTFGSTENKPSIFGSSDAKIPVFGSTDKATPLFNPTPQAPIATPTPTFNAPAAIPTLFGAPVTPAFGGNNSSTFVTESAPNIFSTTKPTETNPPSSNLFTFGTSPAQPVAQPGTGFNFSANTNPAGPTQKPLTMFGSNSNTPQSNNLFGNTFNNPASSNSSGFTFNAPKPKTPTFGQPTAAASPIFGAPQSGTQDQPSSSFPATPANTGFNFGSTAPAASTGGFNFGGVAPAPALSTGFNFNPPVAAPTFNPNIPPSFHFTGGSAPPTFNGTPPQAMLMPRKIKKAVRRIR